MSAAAKPKILTFGKWMPVKLFIGPTEDKTAPINVRPLMWDGKIKEFTTGEPHEVTDRLLVVRRAYRLNDNLPAENKKQPRWVWQLGGWLLVDRTNGHVTNIVLPEFDPFYSDATWYRDYVAYCGVSDNSEKLYAVVAQVGRKKPILKKELGRASNGETPDSECATPQWERNPARITFLPKNAAKVTYSVQGHAADLVIPEESEQAE
jgi:hypothetical protein